MILTKLGQRVHQCNFALWSVPYRGTGVHSFNELCPVDLFLQYPGNQNCTATYYTKGDTNTSTSSKHCQY